jgi:hypothetical protein
MHRMTSATNGSVLRLTLAVHRPDNTQDHDREDRDRGESVEKREGQDDVGHVKTPIN